MVQVGYHRITRYTASNRDGEVSCLRNLCFVVRITKLTGKEGAACAPFAQRA